MKVTVGKLIEKLQQFDKDMIVVRPNGGPLGGYDDVDNVHEFEVCSGEDDIPIDDPFNFKTFKVVVLGTKE